MEGVREGRHLAAILFVDMVGYSARMQENEPRAIAAVRGLWDLVRPLLVEYGGREVDLAGDGMLMEFPGALSAVRSHFDFREGDHPPLRPLWSLIRHLGQGGHGEVWLAKHDKTKEERVYKFALDPAHLASLKREITLSRVLNDTHGAKSCFVRILDWNLEELSYFIESEYSRQGSMVDWANTQGGLSQIPLQTRLDLAAQTAAALAAAHSVGVLHKDLKPSNVLIEASPSPPLSALRATLSREGRENGKAEAVDSSLPPRGGEPTRAARGERGEALTIKLCDFGSGGVLDPHRLEDLGITRMGFTKTILDVSGSTSGTPLYLAPEILAGQPWTSQADIYALGVMLYQLIVGDFKRPLAPGWELKIEDELLREDIAASAAGDTALRQSLALEVRRYGPNHWRTQRVREELARVTGP